MAGPLGDADPFGDIALDGGQHDAYSRGLAEGAAALSPLELRDAEAFGRAEGEALGALLGSFTAVAAALPKPTAGAAAFADPASPPAAPQSTGAATPLAHSAHAFAATTAALVAEARTQHGFPTDDAARHAMIDRLMAQCRRCDTLCRGSRGAVSTPAVLREFQRAFAPGAGMDW